MTRLVTSLLVVFTLFLNPSSDADASRFYEEAEHGGGRLYYDGEIPVLVLTGSPKAMGEQQIALIADKAKTLIDVPPKILRDYGVGMAWPLVVRLAESRLALLPASQRQELEASIATGKLNKDEMEALTVINTMWEYMSVGCSSIVVHPERSADGAMLFGRNFDWPDYGCLGEAALLVVRRPVDKHAFASIGFPAVNILFSGINDSGLCVAVHSANTPSDGSPQFNHSGEPVYANLRRLLEECETVAEAEAFFRARSFMSRHLIVICDPSDSAVVELTTKGVYVRKNQNGALACTNHYRCKAIAREQQCRRFDSLNAVLTKRRVLGRNDLIAALSGLSPGFTLQSMVFEPIPRRIYLHVSHPYRGEVRPLQKIDLQKLLTE